MQRSYISTLLIWLACLWAVWTAWAFDANLHLAKPHWLILPALWLAWPLRNHHLKRLQALVFLYLVMVVVSAGFPVFWNVGGIDANEESWRVSYSLGFIVLAGMGYLLRQRAVPDMHESSLPIENMTLLAVGMVILFGLILIALLYQTFNYGWEEDLSVLGRVGLYGLGLLFIWPLTGADRFRGSLGVVIALLFSLKG